MLTNQVRGIGMTYESLGQTAFAEAKHLDLVPVSDAQIDFRQQLYVWTGTEGRRVNAPVFELGSLKVGNEVKGPALIIDDTQTVFVNM